jgi:predicted transcriptional regulator
MTRTGTIKEDAKRLIDQLPESASWDDVIYQCYVQREITAGIEDCEAGRVVTTDELRKELGVGP